jgi:hypothetical protein
LWASWKAIRQELKNASVRDVVDFLEYDVDPDKWINSLLKQISTGRYEPSALLRFTLGKSLGLSRTMTLPSVPDLVLYRAIVDYLYSKAKRKQHEHVYFRRKLIQTEQKRAQQEASDEIKFATGYRMSSRLSFLNWLKYDQYRKHLLLDRVYPYLVTTDITNFFDSVLHSHVEEALRGLVVPPRMVGLLFFLLERLSIRQDYSGSHGISLPVDEFDCSRTLAHMVLFSHDETMVRLVGESAYVRWMDDQVIGVQSRAEGLHVLSVVSKSLGRLHLTPNSKKSRILSLSEARRHFHLDLNALLDRAEKIASSKSSRTAMNSKLRPFLHQIWVKAQPHEGIGEYGKVLKRLYRLAGTANARFLRRRALKDVLLDPSLAERVCDYMRSSGSEAEYLKFVMSLMNSDEQVYADVNVAATEAFLRLEASGAVARQIRSLAVTFLRGKFVVPGLDECMTIAPLLILRFGDRRSLALLETFLQGQEIASPLALRSCAIVMASYGGEEFSIVRRAAGRLLRNPLASVVLLIKVESGVQVVERWIVAALRNRKFFSLSELNQAIRELLVRLNERPFRKRDGSRASLFQSLEKPALAPLPAERFDMSEWARATVNIDYHVAFDGNFYSVPYTLVQQVVEIRSTPTTVEIFHRGQRVASHVRGRERGKAITIHGHRPKSHQAHLEWPPSRMVNWARTIGPHTVELFERILSDKPHPEMGYRSCLGIIRLAQQYSAQRVEAAAERAILAHACRYQSVKSILKNSLDAVPLSPPRSGSPPLTHDNLRGADYFEQGGSRSC